MKKRVTIGVVGPNNTPVGEAHPKAILTDDEVELIRVIYDEGFLGYEAIAKGFGVSKGVVRNIVTYRRRACTPDNYKTIEITIENEELVEFHDVEE
mgnify:CR=1 FL=1